MLVAEHVFVRKFDNGSTGDRVRVRKWRRGLLILDRNLPRVSGQFQSSVPNPVLPRILPVSSQNGARSGLLSKKALVTTTFGATYAGSNAVVATKAVQM